MVANRKKSDEVKFKSADANADGLLDGAELLHFFHPLTDDGVFQAVMREELRQKDHNGDGKLSRSEFGSPADSPGADEATGHDDGQADDFSSIDADGNSLLELSEFIDWHSGKVHTQAELKELFDRVDKDGDHQISADEIASMHAGMSDLGAHTL